MVRLPRKGVLEGFNNLLPWSINIFRGLLDGMGKELGYLCVKMY